MAEPGADPLEPSPAPADPYRAILLVEDDETLAGLLAHHLEARGFLVDAVGTAEEASGYVRSGVRPWLVLLDINLPGDSGWALLRHGPLAGPDAPPVVVMSAVPVSPARLQEYRVAGYLPKPFPIDALMDFVERLDNTAAGRGPRTVPEGIDA